MAALCPHGQDKGTHTGTAFVVGTQTDGHGTQALAVDFDLRHTLLPRSDHHRQAHQIGGSREGRQRVVA